MAGDWIKMRTNLDTDPAVVRIASALKCDRFAVVGRLHRIWSWANEHLSDGDDVPVDAAFLDHLVECSGFAAAMRDVEWLSGRDGSLCFPCFERHNGESAKKRAQDAVRKRRSRSDSGHKDVTQASGQKRDQRREEKRREEYTHTHTADKPIVPVELEECWRKWSGYIEESQGKKVGSYEAEQCLLAMSRVGPAKAARDVEFSILKRAKSLLDSDNDFSKNRSPPKNGKRGGRHQLSESDI